VHDLLRLLSVFIGTRQFCHFGAVFKANTIHIDSDRYSGNWQCWYYLSRFYFDFLRRTSRLTITTCCKLKYAKGGALVEWLRKNPAADYDGPARGRGEHSRHELVHPRLGGTGFPLWRREELVSMHQDSARRRLVPVSIRRSIRWWIQRRGILNTLHRDPMNQGRKRRISPVEIGLCLVAKRARPTLRADEVTNFVARSTGRVFSRVAVSRALLHYGSHGNMTFKRLEQCPRERDPVCVSRCFVCSRRRWATPRRRKRPH
jgi:hypothetical protein